jgi:nicotinate-nucleotide adenylyltransferase
MKTGLFFGSFNPIHIGHIAIAGYVAEFTDIDEVWFVVSPHNPLKESNTLAQEQHRFKMVNLATEPFSPRMKACDIEMSMPRPSYTIDTLLLLTKKHPEREFFPIVGADSLASIEQWKDFEILLKEYRILVYPRAEYSMESLTKKYNVQFINAPAFNISSTFIRQSIADGKNVDFLLPRGVMGYIKTNNLYNI